MKQLELFPKFNSNYPSRASKLAMSADALHSWKNRIFECQQFASTEQPQQGTLFELTPNPCYSNTLDPFTLQLHRKTSPACLWL
ncbi:MAG: hypothetical protein JGK12_30975 [Microcoleus sp. PH2017_01_SCD_O_A]|uniref:hypothetical protein n=1 Tax=unclassified Microcoleus TaxID=2642155 RepID=UPI001E074C35|nr:MULTISPECIES: hypothetical protein [unclassified Microcoleus]TAG63153.1 MAG: hypothetical protein EAZ25_25350 [Oscillatoriales cyanobacterium]MCC3428223.1 hypothetical protein [Microcoleus sp. PH2017_01_SCD_O_A]MCC3448287.1 hypothetical protein [Microcoleus sp. PH2017_09_SFU_O_A]MCC3629170.1 hypothetical protein [Microcoleus sp. PH2017_39_LGB_O_B]MCC3641255.1 hypothetical protein [Microcoleus sp. PH2017_33_LGB_O_A]